MKTFSLRALFACLLAGIIAGAAGVLRADEPKTLDLGDPAPDFTFVDFENKEHKLSEFRGKNVLLDVWATWCGPCIGEIPTLRAIHEEFKDNEKFVVLSVSIDDKAETAKTYIAKNNMPWMQGHAPGAWKSEVVKKYGITGIPSIWLIGEDGRIMAMNTRRDETLEAVRLLSKGELKINTTPEPDVTVTGVVVDDVGNPVKGAHVVISAERKAKGGRAKKSLSYEETTTGEDGVWTYKMFPGADSVKLGVYHQAYDSCRSDSGSYAIEACKSLPDFYAGKTKQVLERGVQIRGIVKDTAGNPVAKAIVRYGTDLYCSNRLPDIRTDKNGEFVLGSAPGNQAWITVKAKGFAPELQKIFVPKEPTKTEILLKPAKVLTGTVVDADGKPISGARILFDTWRGGRTLLDSSDSDGDGVFKWNAAPEDEILAAAGARNYAMVRDIKLKAGEENKIVLLRPTIVTGKVIDVETGEQLKKCTVRQGLILSERWVDEPSWQTGRSDIVKKDADGNFSDELDGSYYGYAYGASAESYAPAISEIIKPDGKKHEIVIKLKKAKPMSVKITDAAGNPIAGAEVAIVTPNTYLEINNGKFNKQWADKLKTITTDVSGAVEVPSQATKYELWAICDAGIARVKSDKLSAGTSVVLKPWQRISGSAFVGEKPDAGTQISYSYQEKLVHLNFKEADKELRCRCEVVVDNDGNFEIKYALPGFGFLSNKKQSKTIRVTAGETQKIVFGGKGRPVEGRVIVQENLKTRGGKLRCDGFRWVVKPVSESISDKDDDAEIATEVRKDSDFTPEQLTKIADDYFEQRKKEKHYWVEIRDDGSFRVEDVDPGDYVVGVLLEVPPEQHHFGFGNTIASGFLQFTVPAQDKDYIAEPLVLPPVEMKEIKPPVNLSAGTDAPDFVFSDFENNEHKLSDYRGKYVLMDFWATWCGPCIAEIPTIQAVFDEFKNDDRLVVMSLSIDKKLERAKKFAAKKGMPWQQGWLAGEWKNPAIENYGIKGIPSVWLIGPDGKIIAKNLREEKMKEAVRKALGK